MIELTSDERHFVAEAVRQHPDMDDAAQDQLAVALLLRMARQHVQSAIKDQQARQWQAEAVKERQYCTLQGPRQRCGGINPKDTWRPHYKILLSDLPAFAEAVGLDQDKLLDVAQGRRKDFHDWIQGAFYGGQYQPGQPYAAVLLAERKTKEHAEQLQENAVRARSEAKRVPEVPNQYAQPPQVWRKGDALIQRPQQ